MLGDSVIFLVPSAFPLFHHLQGVVDRVLLADVGLVAALFFWVGECGDGVVFVVIVVVVYILLLLLVVWVRSAPFTSFFVTSKL